MLFIANFNACVPASVVNIAIIALTTVVVILRVTVGAAVPAVTSTVPVSSSIRIILAHIQLELILLYSLFLLKLLLLLLALP